MLLWKRYVNNKMEAMRFLHLQQYSHRQNLLYIFYFRYIIKTNEIFMNISHQMKKNDKGDACSTNGGEEHLGFF